MIEYIAKGLMKYAVVAVSAIVVVYLLLLLSKLGDRILFTLNNLPGA